MSESLEFSAAFADAIRNPANPGHLMVLKPVNRRLRIYAGDTLLADSARALRVIEVGKSLYDPVVYVPGDDLVADFDRLEKSTHCPLKGDASYIALKGEELGWAYENPIEVASAIRGYFAFWPQKTRLVEGE
ncbi:DUF427 domain-containing protein [Roseibium aggregatum]|uniref:DUF427 domain-containing protein n=1 Tax=Roseibium aggregatum TaxID=187304 RepID=A0A926P204_9HYPH|nr:DUF427 domain-containing protein [Roseibium aggregatum]MBD1545501.1 DUF427 domain-containing protein [Roseibium aggregatum]